MLKRLHFDEGTLIGFKAWSHPSIPLLSEISEISSLQKSSLSADWQAIYPQLSFKRALAYLSNQWERGYKVAYIVSLRTKKPLDLLLQARSQCISCPITDERDLD